MSASFAFLPLVMAVPLVFAASPAPSPSQAAVDSAVARLTRRHGEAHAERIRTGVRQVANRWWRDDGDEEAFVAFCQEHFVATEAERTAIFERLESVLEQIDGHLHEVRREVTRPLDLDLGPLRPIDRKLGDFDLQAHVTDDLFRSQVAFIALLNFPIHTLAERLEKGPAWSREDWARSRLMDRFAARVPSAVLQQMTRATTAADQYIAGYNIRMDRLALPNGDRPFPEGLRLISHWGLRDEIASHYASGAEGLPKQRMIQKVMERIVRQEIPSSVLDDPGVVWCPETNEVRPVPGGAPLGRDAAAREPDTRYARWLDVARAARLADPYFPTAPSFIARRFELDRQMPVSRVEALLVSVLESPEVAELARRIARRLGRPLEPFDLWYAGFKARGVQTEEQLDRRVRSRYPDVSSFQADLPRILGGLGFRPEKAAWLASKVVVDPSRGAGHALGAVRRGDQARLRTRVASGGMDYKGYNIAIHEFGHNVEQIFSLDGIDHWSLAGVPNNGFTEAIAFVFQGRDLEILGLAPRGDAERRRDALATLWSAYEIGGVALIDLRAWQWLEDHPDATPAQLREAVLRSARDVWNRWYAPHFGSRDVELLAIYSHMVSYPLYLADYPLGHLIAFQVAAKLRSGDFGAEIERMTRQGRLTPDQWMRGAVGSPISSAALLAAAREALDSPAE